MQQYVAGFLFSETRAEVLLIEKNRPAWQSGRFNGIGGKVEPGETPIEAMRREMREESGLDIENWDHYVTLEGDGRYQVHMFRAMATGKPAAESLTDEHVSWQSAKNLPANIIANLSWLVPLALDRDIHGPIQVLDLGPN